jgi:hypothetical protein
MKHMNKKGQFYIFVAVIFCSLALTLVLSNFGTRGYKSVFENVKENFVTESSYVINSALYSDLDIRSQFDEFIGFYKNYSLTKNVNFRFLYFLVHDDVLHMNNQLDFDVAIETSTDRYDLPAYTNLSIVQPDYVDVDVDNFITTVPFTNDTTQIKMYFRLGLIN